MADRIIEIRRILYSLDPEIFLPSGIHADTDSLRKVLQLLSKTSRENMKSICEQVLNALKKSTDDCLRNWFVQALSTNDVEKAQLCMNILKNKNYILADNPEYDISSTNGNIYSSFLKNLSSLSNKKDNFNQSYRADESVCLIRANSELNYKPLPAILETQSQAELAKNQNTNLLKPTEKQMHNGKDSRVINNHTGNKQKQLVSRPKPLALNDSSDSEPVAFPKRLLGFKQPTTDKNNVSKPIEKLKSVPTPRDHDSRHQDESQDSGDLFWPANYKKSSPQYKRRLEESDPERGGGKPRNRSSSNMFSPAHQSARKAYLSKHRVYRKEVPSSSDSDCETTRKTNNQDIGGYKKHSTKYLRKRRYSDSDIPSTSEKTVRTSKSKQYENNNSNFEKNTRKSLKTNKNKSTKRRKKYHSDSMEHERSSPEKVRLRRDQHITSKRVKRSVSCSSETSSSPDTVICKHANKKLKGKIRESSYCESETDLDSNPKKKTSRRGKNYKVLESETRASNKMSKTAPTSKQMPTNSKNKTVKSRASENVKKKNVESVESWEDTSENYSSFSESESESERLNNSKFMSRLKELESSILQGNPDPLGTNAAKNKNNKSPTVPNKNSNIVSNKAKTNKKSSAVSSKKSPAVSSKKSSTVSSKKSAVSSKKSPAVSSKKSSAVSSKKSPAVSSKKSPTVSSKKSPEVASKKSSAISSKKSSAVSSKKSPAVSRKKSPAVSRKKSSAVSSKKSPAVSSKKSAVSSKKSPVVTKKKSPAITKKSPAIKTKKSPVVVKSNGDTNKESSTLKNNKKPMNSKRKSVVKPPKPKKPGAVKNKKNVSSQAKKGSGSVQTNRKKVTGNKKQNDEPTIGEDETVSPHNKKITGETFKKSVILNQKNATDSNDKEREETGNSSLSSDESFMSDLEMEPQIGSLSTCLNSIKKKLPRQVGTATPPIKMFLSANSDAMSEASAASSFDKIPVKFDDKNIIKRMAKANKPKETESNQPTISNLNGEANNTPEALRKVMKINKKFEEKHDSEIECSSFSDS